MDNLKLVRPTMEYSEQILSYRKEFLNNDESMDGTSGLKRYEIVEEWLEWLKKNEDKETCSSNWVPTTQFLCIRQSDDKLIGMIDVRHELNDYLRNFAGQIGYSVRKSERRKGYAKVQLRLALLECKKLGINKVLICCDKNNIASKSVIIGLGGIFENEVYDESDNTMTQRYWIDNL